MPPHVHTNFRGPPSWLWRKCNRLLRLGRAWGAVTLSRWCEGWYIGRWGASRGLKSRSTNYPDHSHHGDPPPTRKIPHGRAGNRTRDLVISSQKLWPLDHEAGLLLKVYLQTFLSIPITQKCRIFICDTLVANERYSVRQVTWYLTLLLLHKWFRWCITVKKARSFIYSVFRCRTEVCCAESQRDKAICSVKAAYGPTPTAGAETPLILSSFQVKNGFWHRGLILTTIVTNIL